MFMKVYLAALDIISIIKVNLFDAQYVDNSNFYAS